MNSLSEIFLGYIACLNRQDWSALQYYVRDDVRFNGKQVGIDGYRNMLTDICDGVPDIYFAVQILVSEPPFVSSRLQFDCTPAGSFLGLAVRGKRIRFAENAFYEFDGEKIRQIWSVVDKAAIQAQL